MTRTPYNTARAPHPAAQLVPPFSFRGVTMQVFPLVADMDRLQQFVDRFIHDIAPESVGRFRVHLPYVYLQIVHYGEMSVAAARGGWISQHEVNFTIPLAWYASDGGRLVFKDWAYLTPYMFVDSPLSMTTGRELGGWPKAPGYLEFGENGRTIASVATGPNHRERRALLRLEEAPPLSSLLSWKGASSYPWAGGRGVTKSAIAWAIRSARLLREGGLLREPPGSAAPSASQLLDRLARFVVGLHTSRPHWMALNLKQFPNPKQPRVADYQGLVATRLSFDRIDWMSLVGRRALLLGDVTGGHRVELHECHDFPIVDTLALDVAATRRGAHGERVAVLAPVFPFRLEFDMTHPPGEVLAWRTPFSQGWRRSDGSPAGAARADDAAPPVQAAHAGAATASSSMDADLLVLPLLADSARLQAFCAAYFDATLAATPYRVEAWGPYAYLVAARAVESSERGQVVEILVPVRWYCDDVLRGVALVPVLSYADRADVAARRSEVEGLPTSFAVFSSSREDRPWLTVLTEELSTPGQPAGLRPVVEIRENSPAATTASCLINDALFNRLEQERRRKAAIAQDQGLAPEPVLPREVLTLKQFRDAGDPASACYQSVVVSERAIKRVLSLAELEHPIEVRLHECLGQPIVKTLGLQWKAVDVGAPTAIYILAPCRPFQARVSMRQSGGQTLVARAGSEAWIASPLAAVSPGVWAVEPQIVLESILDGEHANKANEVTRMRNDHTIDDVEEGRRA